MNITTDNSRLPQYQQIFVSASIPTAFRFQIPKTGSDEHGYLTPGSPLTPQWQEKTYVVDLSDDPSKQTAFSAVRLTSNSKIDIQASKVTKGSADGFLVLPLTSESTEFYIPSYQGLPVGHSSFLVVSPNRDTCVEASFVNGSDVRRIFFRSLKAFEVFQSYSMTEDYTGVHVRASGPVAVFGGHECAQVPEKKMFCDHIAEQVPPVSEWGSRHIIGPIAGRAWQAGYVFRVVAGFNDTTVTCRLQNGQTLPDPVSLNRGTFAEYQVSDNRQSVYCECTKNCLIAQYNPGYQAWDPNKDVKTDPWMTTITPLDHFTNHMTFSTLRYWADTGTKPFTSYLTIVTQTAAKSGIRLNKNQLPVNDEKFVGYVYGHSEDTNPAGYGYATGYDIKGSPLPEKMWDELLTTAAPSVCTKPRTLPPANDRGPDMEYSLNIQLINNAQTEDCIYKYKIILEKTADELKDLINKLICLGVLCQQTTQTFLTKLAIDRYQDNGANKAVLSNFVINIQAATSLDENIGELIKCKRSVIAFLQERYNWNMPQAVMAGCPILDIGDIQLILDRLRCD
ncbi:hypothetical protein LSH36_50g04046 [Paralvinella palmiformis]|uniref:IgGFc-binding protein N-terminal domain-containing protein n=1 Tax=Paralvinella palmiformis TaxID=53620 RepID=A0AAD9K5T2_9ANNE|nr:hypothetical protein LSH36_50g04046 [Paralvinella palmiformis]